MVGVSSVMQGARAPFFSIGVTTYNRPELLCSCLASILEQTFGDFEVIVGNDYTERPVTCESLGIDDSRLRILNHPVNLGERGNLNALLAASRAPYFTWQADDDCYDRLYLESIAAALEAAPEAKAAFTGFSVVRGNSLSAVTPPVAAIPTVRTMSGSDFLTRYFAGHVSAMGLVGMYSTGYLREGGGVRALAGARIAVMSEYYLLLRASKLPAIAYVGAPLVVYRAHETSWSAGGAAAQVVEDAGLNLLRDGVQILLEPPRSRNFIAHLRGLIRLVFRDVMKTLARHSGPAEALSRGRSYVRRATAVIINGSKGRGLSRFGLLFYSWLIFLLMLPQTLFISASSPGVRRRAIRARGWFRGEFFKPSVH